MITYLYRLFVSLDQLVNVILGPVLNHFLKVDGFGYPDETLSSVFSKYPKDCQLCKKACLILHWFDKDHCEEAREDDEGVQ